jgi:hypothetical protein
VGHGPAREQVGIGRLGNTVQADRRLEPGLQVGGVDQAHAVVGQRLLDHRQPVAVERAKQLRVGRRAGGVAVDVKRQAREGRSSGLHTEVGAHRDRVGLAAQRHVQQLLRRADVLADQPRRQMLAHRVVRGQGVVGGVRGDVGRAAL